VCFALLTSTSLQAFCQNTKPLEQIAGKLYDDRVNTPTEHIYIQLNKPWYTRGDTIWFKGYTVIGGGNLLSALSGVAYLELISPNDTLCERLNLKLEKGMAWGDIPLPISLMHGTYRIRAYTNWMKNQGEDSFYDQPIVIGNPNSTPQKTDPKNALLASGMKNKTGAAFPDIQFFPEGGELVNGLRNVVAFKAVNPNGTPALVSGVIKDPDGTVVAEMQSGHEGMGRFIFAPQAGETYTAALTFANGPVQTIALPKAVDAGFTLIVNNREKDTLTVNIAASRVLFNNKVGKAFYLIGWSGGRICYTTGGNLDEPVYSIKIPKNRFATGIARFTLFNETGEAVNERVAFIRQGDMSNLKIKADARINTATGKVKIELDACKSAVGTYSAAVINEDKVPVDENAEPTIFTQLLLSSEIHGNIHNPAYYLANADEKTQADLDLLVLTQGYRKLERKKLADTIKQKPKYAAEDGLSLSGLVTTANGKPVKNVKVGLFYLPQLLKIDTLTDSVGRFSISGLDIIGTAKLRLQATDNKKSNLTISIDKPANAINSLTRLAETDSLPPQLSIALTKSYQDEEKMYLKNKSTILKEVKIHSVYDPDKNKPDLSTSSNIHGGGEADQVVMGIDLVKRGCIDLKECLRISGNTYEIKKFLSKPTPPLTYIDGVVGDINGISANDIYSVEILVSGKYTSVYGHSVILITTKRGIPPNEEISEERTPGLLNYTFTGYYQARTFYQPKYDPVSGSNQPSAIYWKPDIMTDKDGKADFNYTNAGKGNYRVVIEGIDADGNLGRAVYKYKVE